jgi:hypothetical protein
MRVVRKFAKTQTVRSLFEFVKSQPGMDKRFEVRGKMYIHSGLLNLLRFQILNFRDALFSKLDVTLADAKVVNTSVNVDFIDN